MRNANRKLNTLLPAGYAAVAAVSLALQLAAQRGRAGLLPVLWVFFLSGALILLQLLRGRLRLLQFKDERITVLVERIGFTPLF